MTCDVSVIIPNWNGKAFLKRCVSAALSSAQQSGLRFEILLVDDYSTDGSADDIVQEFPMVTVHKNPHNVGFGETVNRGARAATGHLLVLLNNDLVAKGTMIERLCQPLMEKDVFGVSAKTLSWEGHQPNHLNMCGRLEQGRFRLTWSDDATAVDTMFLQGGSCAVKRDLFLSFGGFSPIYAPGYWEDYDISYQALKAGYRNIYEPAAVGNHLGQGSMIRAHGIAKIDTVKFRNQTLFSLLNFDPANLNEVLKRLPYDVARGESPRLLSRVKALGDVVKRGLLIRQERSRRAAHAVVTDNEVFSRFAGSGEDCQ